MLPLLALDMVTRIGDGGDNSQGNSNLELQRRSECAAADLLLCTAQCYATPARRRRATLLSSPRPYPEHCLLPYDTSVIPTRAPVPLCQSAVCAVYHTPCKTSTVNPSTTIFSLSSCPRRPLLTRRLHSDSFLSALATLSCPPGLSMN